MHGPARMLASASALALALILNCASPAHAQTASGQPYRAPDTPHTVLTNPADEARYKALAHELRCLVCQNQTLADSNAELAADLRNQVESMIVAGRSNDQIKQYLVERYGEFVLYRPPVERSTWLLWFGPFGLLAIGIASWFFIQRSRRPASGVGGLDREPLNGAPNPDEATQERARRLLDRG